MRWLAIFSFSAAAAIFALQYGAEWTVIFVGVLVLAAIIIGLFQKRSRRLAVFVFAMGVAFGSCYQLIYDSILIQPARMLEGIESTTTVTVCDYPQEHTFQAKCTAMLDVGAPLPVKVEFYGDKALLDCVPGDEVTAHVTIKSAEVVGDEKITSFTAKGSHLRLYSEGALGIRKADHIPLRYFPIYLNHLLQKKVSDIYDGQAEVLMTALLTGSRAAFDNQMYSVLSETGVTHVTAVSGMHCAFLFGIVRLLIRNRRKATLVGLPVLFLFMLMVGAAPSVMRACFMLTMLSMAPLFHRENDSITTMGFALLLILLQNPFAAASISLQLSFLSVAGILLFSNRIYEAFKKWFIQDHKPHLVVNFVLSAFATTFAASIFTVPVVAYYFDCVTLIAPLTNLLCLSAVAFAFCGGFFSLLIGFICMPIAQIIAIFPTAALDYFMAVAEMFAKIPYHAVYTNNPYLGFWLIYFYSMLAILLCAKKRGKRTIAMASALSVATLCLVIALPMIAAGKAHMTAKVLDVGQGESVLFASGEKVALLDCGSSNSWINAGAIAANEINTMGYPELDYLILTHYHNDHANGVDTLFSRMKVKTLIAPDKIDPDSIPLKEHVLKTAKENGTEIILIDDEMTLPFGHASLHLYPPQGSGNSNEIGLSLLCSFEDFDMLVTGDMDQDTEEVLISNVTLPDLEVLVAGHHGSKYSTVIPTGANSYGHPTQEAMLRLLDICAEVYRTDLNGTVAITVY